MAGPRGDHQRRGVRSARLPRRHDRGRGARRVVPAACRGVEPVRRSRNDPVVLEHGGRLGNRAPAARGPRLGLRAGDHLGQGNRPRGGERQREDDQALSRRDRGLRVLPAAVRGPRARRAAAGAGVGAARVETVRAAAGAGQRRLWRAERGDPQVPDARLALVLAPRGDDRAARRLRQRARRGGGLALLLPRRRAAGHGQGVGRAAVCLAAHARPDQRLATGAAARGGADQGHAAARGAAGVQPELAVGRAPEPEATRVHAPHRGRRNEAGRGGVGAVRRAGVGRGGRRAGRPVRVRRGSRPRLRGNRGAAPRGRGRRTGPGPGCRGALTPAARPGRRNRG